MARESSAIVGSGINPLKTLVCVNNTTKERHLRGTQVVLINPEDASAGNSGVATQLTVSTSAAKLPTTPMKYRRAIAIFNNSSETLYIGFDPSVTTGNGWPIPASSSLPMDINAAVEVYGIASSSIDVRILELS